jgi:hypothetical protein
MHLSVDKCFISFCLKLTKSPSKRLLQPIYLRMKNIKHIFHITAVVMICSPLFGGCDNSELDRSEADNTENKTQAVVGDPSETVDYYYWYGDKKIIFATGKDLNKQYLVYSGSDQVVLSSLANSASITSSDKLHLGAVVSPDGICKAAAEVSWAIIEGKPDAVNRKDVPGIRYQSFFYKGSSGESVGISHLFRVKLKSDSDEGTLYDMADKYGIEVLGHNQYMKLWYTLACDSDSAGDALQMANTFYESGLFSASEPDIMTGFKYYANPNDSYFDKQWNLSGTNSINWLPAHELTHGENISVAVVDSGVQEFFHPDLPNVSPMYDAYTDSWYIAPVYDPHGTACAGIIGATVNNDTGVAGIAPEVEIISISTNATFNHPNVSQDFATGVYLGGMNADVVSCSWGGVDQNFILDDAIYLALWSGRNGKGAVVVFASGNDNYGSVGYPANSNDGLIVVGAIGQNGRRWIDARYYNVGSNYGATLDVMAPGVNIPTTDLLWGGGYDSGSDYFLNFTGTSAACPHVAAVAALVLSVNNDLTHTEVAEIIEQTAQKKGGYSYATTSGRPNGTWNSEMGYGVVDAYAAVQEAIDRL